MITADQLARAQSRYCDQLAAAGRAFREIVGPAQARFDNAAAEARSLGPKVLIPPEHVAAYLSAMHRAQVAFERIERPARAEIDAVLAERKGLADAGA